MQQVEMLKCPCCGEYTLHPMRKQLGYHVCVNCSTTKPVVGITTVEGSGDHTYNDIIIMDQDRAKNIAEKAAELTGKAVHIEVLNFDDDNLDEFEQAQNLKDTVQNILEGEEEEQEEEKEENAPENQVQGIDY